jgi:3-hydroxypropanoate dehydrogenase
MAKLPSSSLEQIFINARTHNGWLDRSVEDSLLHEVYDLMKWGPTSANTSPARIVFVKNGPFKEKLLATLSPGNLDKTRAAPVTAIIAADHEFYEKLPKLFPHADARSWFLGNDALIQTTIARNSALQGAYFMIAARALGLDCGPMSGFDNAKLDAAFFEGTKWKSNFICSLGYGDASKLFPRSPRLPFDEACKII